MSLTIEDLEQINTIVTKVVTNAVGDATKGLATKDELYDVVDRATKGLATKAGLHDAINQATSGLATKSELRTSVKGLATKVDLDRMESRLVASISLVERDTFDRLDEHEKRIVHLEKVVAR